MLGHRDFEVEAIEEVLDDVVINSVVDGSMSEHAASVAAPTEHAASVAPPAWKPPTKAAKTDP